MENQFAITELLPGIRLVAVKTDRFKTSRVSISFALPLAEESASANALAVYLLHRSCQKYPDFSRMNERLAELYGALVNARVEKQGDAQVMTLYVNALDDQFTLDGEPLAEECAQLLCDMLFSPVLAEGTFPAESVEMEKRLLRELLESERNDKRAYAKTRCEEIMCAQEPYGVGKYGTVEQIDALTPTDVYNAWRAMVQRAQVQICVIGSADATAVGEQFCKGFEQASRSYEPLPPQIYRPQKGQIRRVREELPVNQGKLVMGFRSNMADANDRFYAFRVMADLYGGGPYSRLFLNVREKLSLCYYCSARFSRIKGLLFVSSGVERENMQRAQAEICNQLQMMQDSAFTDEELEASVKGLSDLIRSVSDMPSDLDNWYTSQLLVEEKLTPEAFAQGIAGVTRADVVQAAQSVALDTVYMLEPNGGEEQA